MLDWRHIWLKVQPHVTDREMRVGEIAKLAGNSRIQCGIGLRGAAKAGLVQERALWEPKGSRSYCTYRTLQSNTSNTVRGSRTI